MKSSRHLRCRTFHQAAAPACHRSSTCSHILARRTCALCRYDKLVPPVRCCTEAVASVLQPCCGGHCNHQQYVRGVLGHQLEVESRVRFTTRAAQRAGSRHLSRLLHRLSRGPTHPAAATPLGIHRCRHRSTILAAAESCNAHAVITSSLSGHLPGCCGEGLLSPAAVESSRVAT